MIDIDIRGKSFGDTPVLSTIRIRLSKGETVALLGPSGVGKTTLLRIVAGLDADYQGAVERPGAMAMVFQEPTLLPWRTALQNIVLVADVSGDAARAALDTVGIGDKANLFPGQLSLGQRRRLALARAFALQPRFLIMDEPFASLDQKRIDDMVDLTRSLIAATDVTTLMVTHSEQEASRLADRVLRIDGAPACLIDG